MAKPSRRVLTNAVIARLEALGPTVYVGHVPDTVKVIPGDTSGHVVPYLFLMPSGGQPLDDIGLEDTNEDLTYQAHINCVAAYVEDLDHLVDRVVERMHRWSPVIAGYSSGQFRPPPGYDPGPHRADRSVSPPRFVCPLIYRLDTAT